MNVRRKSFAWWAAVLARAIALPGLVGAANLRDPENGSIFPCLLMIVRDEEHNLRQNLWLWAPFISCYVIGLDARTTDGSEAAVHEALDDAVLPNRRSVFQFEFDGLGHARTLVLQEAWRRFPDATHLIMADPDWRVHPETIDLSQLDFSHSIFALKIWDRNGSTNRWIDWIFLHLPGLSMRYRWHEALVLPPGVPYAPALLRWEVSEVETNSSWHVKQHGSSFSYERYVMEIGLLERDDAEHADDPRVLYYLGIDNLIAASHARNLAAAAADAAAATGEAGGAGSGGDGVNIFVGAATVGGAAAARPVTAAEWFAVAEQHLDEGMRRLERRVDLGLAQTPSWDSEPRITVTSNAVNGGNSGDDENGAADPNSRRLSDPNMTWAALFWLAYGNHHLRRPAAIAAGDDAAAAAADAAAAAGYARCAAFDPARADCLTYLSLLHMEGGRPAEAWQAAAAAAALPMPERSFMNNAEVYKCLVPQQAARAAASYYLAATGALGPEAAATVAAAMASEMPAVEVARQARRMLTLARQGCTDGQPLRAPAELFDTLERVISQYPDFGDGASADAAAAAGATGSGSFASRAVTSQIGVSAAVQSGNAGDFSGGTAVPPSGGVIIKGVADLGIFGGARGKKDSGGKLSFVSLSHAAGPSGGAERSDTAAIGAVATTTIGAVSRPAAPAAGTAAVPAGDSVIRGGGGGESGGGGERGRGGGGSGSGGPPRLEEENTAVRCMKGAPGAPADFIDAAAAILAAEGRAVAAAGLCLRRAYNAAADTSTAGGVAAAAALSAAELVRHGIGAETAKDSLYLHVLQLDAAAAAARAALDSLVAAEYK